MSEIPTKPYLLRAIYEWCADNGYTPFMAVSVDGATQVPMQFVRDGQIVLNISQGATKGLKMDNDSVRFAARFGGVARDVYVPVDNVIAIYASENGQGMAFEAPPVRDEREPPRQAPLQPVPAHDSTTGPDGAPEPPKNGGKPTLTRIK